MTLAVSPAATLDANAIPAAKDWDAWLTPGRFALLLALLIAAAFPDVLTGTHTFFYRDYGCFGYPLAHHHREAFWRGEVPLWNPLNNCGLPFLAQWNTMVFYPLSVIYLTLPMPWALGFFVLGHLFLAGLGMYFLAHRWTGNRFAASVAGVAWALNGLTLHALMWPNNIAALAWMPFVVLLLGRAVREGGRMTLLAALAGATQVLAGAPEIILFTWALAGALALIAGEVQIRVRVMRLAFIAFVIAGLSAVQMFPFLDLLWHSQRDQTFVTNVWAMPAWGWANFIVPLFRCSPSITGGVFSQDEQQWTSSYYAGLSVLALAAVAVWRCRERRVFLLAAATLFSLVLALGDATFVYPLCKKFVPGFSVIRYPIKFVVPALFALPLLAAMAVAHWQRLPAARKTGERWRWLTIGGAFLGLVMVVLSIQRLHPVKGIEWDVVLQNGLVRATLLAVTFGALILLPFLRAGALGALCRLAVIAALGLDVLTHAPRQNPTVPVAVFARDSLERGEAGPPDGSRAMLSPRAKAFLDYAALADTRRFCLGQRQALVPNWNLLEGIPTLGGFYSLYTREQRQVLDLFYASTNFPSPLADFAGMARISAADNPFAWDQRARAMPLVTAGQQPHSISSSETRRAIAAPGFDPKRVVCLPEAARASTASVQSGKAKVISFATVRGITRAEIEAEAPSVVTVAQTYYHWWAATVNGRPAKVWPANHAFQAVIVPAGRSVVELAYRDRGFTWGAVVSLAAALGCISWWWLERRASRANFASR